MAALVALFLQVGGLLIAAGALVLEWRSETKLKPQQLARSPRGRQNPWEVQLRLPRPNMVHRRTSTPGWGRSQSDIEIESAVIYQGEVFTTWIKERQKLLAADWKTQASHDRQMHDELVRLFNEQSRLVTEQQNRTRRRVMWEMFGLAVSLSGTVLANLAG